MSIFRNKNSPTYSIDVEKWKELDNPHQRIVPTTGYTLFIGQLNAPECLESIGEPISPFHLGKLYSHAVNELAVWRARAI